MEQKEVIEGNRLIAIFMGAKEHNEFSGHPLLDFGDFIKTTPFNEPGVWILGDSQVRYHSSWDWIMPVVEKIESLGYDSRIIGNNSDGGFLCDFVDIENNEAACKTSYTSKIQAVWLAVVDFIRWYNEQTKKEDTL